MLEKMTEELKNQVAEIRAQVADLRKEIHEYKMSGVGRRLDAEYKEAKNAKPKAIRSDARVYRDPEEFETGELGPDLGDVAYFVATYQNLADYRREIEDRRKAIRIERENARRKLRRLRLYVTVLESL